METKKTIVLLHGFGEDSRIFQTQKDALTAAGYHVLTPDLPGSGRLNRHAWTSHEMSIDWLADWVKLYLETQSVTSCVMLGHSMGGYITLAFAEKYSDFLLAFGLIHSTSFADGAAKKETRTKAIAFMEEKGGFAFLKTAIPGLFGSAFARERADVVEGLIQQAAAFENAALTAYYIAMRERPDRSHVLKNATVPVLIIAGTEDNAAPLNDLLEQASLPPVCQFHVLPHTGHMGMLEKPEVLNHHLLNFMDLLQVNFLVL